jgi:hypothetical protein
MWFQTRNRFYRQGYNSRKRNLELYPDPPYSVHSRAYEDWLAGWHCRDAEIIAELRRAGFMIAANAATSDIATLHPIIT